MTYDYPKRISAKDALKNKWFLNAPDQEIDKELMKEAFANLSSFNATQKMQQATMSMMV